MIFLIDNNDISGFIVAGSYDVNLEEITSDWIDATHTYRKKHIRDRVVGSFDMLFLKKSDYDNFCNLMKNSKIMDGGYYNCRFYCNNYPGIFMKKMRLYFEPIRNRKSDGLHLMEKFRMKVEEI